MENKSKNKLNLQVNWPTEDEYWTVKDLLLKNQGFKEITLRVRLADAINKYRTVEVIGDLMMPQGRPQMVCAMKNSSGGVSTKALIEAQKNERIRLNHSISIPVVNINSTENKKEMPVNLNPVLEEAIA